MRPYYFPAALVAWISTAIVLLAGAPSRGLGADMKGEAILVWGTTNSAPPAGKNYKPVDQEILRKLKALPLKWSNWFEVRRRPFSAAPAVTQEVTVSDKCRLTVRNLGGDAGLEVVLIGKGKEVVKRRQPLPVGEMLVVGGNAPDATSWLVILKRTE